MSVHIAKGVAVAGNPQAARWYLLITDTVLSSSKINSHTQVRITVLEPSLASEGTTRQHRDQNQALGISVFYGEPEKQVEISLELFLYMTVTFHQNGGP